MKTTKQQIAIMKAYDEGQKVEVRLLKYHDWKYYDTITFDWVHYDYRIKPEIKYMTAEEISSKLIKQGVMAFREITTGNVVAVNTVDVENNKIIIVNVTKIGPPELSFSILDPYQLKDNYTFLDGTGFVVEE